MDFFDSFHHFLETAFLLTELNQLCSNKKEIVDLNECRQAANYFKMNVDIKEETNPLWPKGCYTANDGKDDVYFNKIKVGSKNKDARQICKSMSKNGISVMLN